MSVLWISYYGIDADIIARENFLPQSPDARTFDYKAFDKPKYQEDKNCWYFETLEGECIYIKNDQIKSILSKPVYVDKFEDSEINKARK